METEKNKQATTNSGHSLQFKTALHHLFSIVSCWSSVRGEGIIVRAILFKAMDFPCHPFDLLASASMYPTVKLYRTRCYNSMGGYSYLVASCRRGPDVNQLHPRLVVCPFQWELLQPLWHWDLFQLNGIASSDGGQQLVP